MVSTGLFLKLFRRVWQTRHPLFKIGVVGIGLSQVVSSYILDVTPPALWNGARSLVEQEIVLALQAGSMVLLIAGAGLNLCQEAKAAQKRHDRIA